MKRRFIALAASASLFPLAAMAGEFETLDADGSGALSYGEVRAVAPDLTAEQFVAVDIDGSGDLSRGEYDAWKSASMAPKE